MAEVILYHHALGLTPGVVAFADDLRAAGHTVHTPDLYEGRTFADVDSGVEHAKSIGFEVIAERGRAAAEGLPTNLVYAGFSLGVISAQMLAQTRPGAKGAVLMHSTFPLSEFGGSWPDGVPMQIHTMEGDGWGDVDVAREVAAEVPGAALYLYPGDGHLFAERGFADHDPAAASLLMQRVLRLLSEAG